MSRLARTHVRDTSIGAAVVLFVVAPLLFTDKSFGLDSTNHIWLIWLQGLAIAHDGHPTLFMSAENQGVLEPFFGFYGGTLYAFAGTISAALGGRAGAAYTLCSALFVGMAYRGVWSLAHQAGVRAFAAHLPALTFATSAYYLNDLYARSAWPEFAALSALPFALAYGLRLLRERWTTGTVAAFAFGTVLLTGSHNISPFWSSLIIAIVAGAAYLLAGSRRPPLRSVGAVFGLTVLCVLVNAWFLALDLLHAGDTAAAIFGFPWDSTRDFDWFSSTLTPFRTTPAQSTTIGLTVTAPVLAVAGAVWLWTKTRRPAAAEPVSVSATARRRVLWVVVLATVALVEMIRMPLAPWTALGVPFTLIQFPYRLAGWVALGCALILALSIGLLGEQPARERRKFRWAAAAFVAITVIQAGLQLWPSTSSMAAMDRGFWERPRSEAFQGGPSLQPPSWYDSGLYRDASLPQIQIDPARQVWFDLPKPGVTEIHAKGELPEGTEPIQTNIAGGLYVLSVKGRGIRVVGRTIDGWLVIARTPESSGPVDITIAADGGSAQFAASTVSILAVLTLLGLIGALARRGRRARDDRGHGAASPAGGADARAAAAARADAIGSPQLDKV